MIKHINSDTRKFQDVMTDNLVLDSQATEGSFNAITSDAVYRAVQEGGGGGGSDIPEHKKGDRGKYLRVNESDADTLEWSDVEAEIDAGDGIEVEGSTVSVKAGTGLSIGDYRKTEQFTDDYYVTAIEQGLWDSSYSLPYIVPLADVFEEINSTSSFHLTNSWFRASTDFNDPDPTPFYWAPAIVLKSEAETVNFTQPFSQIEVLSTTARQSTKYWNSDAQLIEGEADGEGVTIPISFDDINQDLSNFDFDPSSVNPDDYAITFVLVNSDCTSLISGDRLLGWSNYWKDSAGTFAYERTVTKHHALNVANPVPTYADSDAGKVLSVNGSGTGLEWGVAGGGASNVEVIDLPDTDASDETLYDILSQLNTAMMVTGKVVFGRIHFYDADDDSGKDYYIPMTKHVNHGAETYYFTVFTTANDAESSATSPMTIYYYECQIGRDMDGENPYIAYYTGYIHPSDINTWTPYPSNE